MPTKPSTGKAPMSQQHKDALALGREEGRAVRRYLEALEEHKPRRGRQRTPESIKRRIAEIDRKSAVAGPLPRMLLVQERMNLREELVLKHSNVDLGALEVEFVRMAKGYGDRKGISYAAWREAGVDAAILRRAGISRRSNP